MLLRAHVPSAETASQVCALSRKATEFYAAAIGTDGKAIPAPRAYETLET